MSNFTDAVNFVLDNEKGFVNNPKDEGGATNFGISLRFLKSLSSELRRAYGIYDMEITVDTIFHLTREQAIAIYQGEFWKHASFDKIRNQNLCNYIFDMAVNLGISPAIKCVQRACWAVMKKWELLPEDGILGNKTIDAIQICGFFLLPAIRAERGNFYRALVEKTPEQKEFIKGWYDRTYNK